VRQGAAPGGVGGGGASVGFLGLWLRWSFRLVSQVRALGALDGGGLEFPGDLAGVGVCVPGGWCGGRAGGV